jgi:hypothetical protein
MVVVALHESYVSRRLAPPDDATASFRRVMV